MPDANQITPVEPFHTLPQAAKLIGIPASTLRRAANAGLIPTHRPFGERIRVRLSEIESAIATAQNGELS